MREIIYSTNFEETPVRTKFSMVVPFYGDEVREVAIRDARHYPHYFLDGARHDLTEEEKKYINSVLDEVKKVSANQNRKGDGICSKSLTRV